MGTADFVDWCRFGVDYRRQDCQRGFTTKDTKNHKGHKEHDAGSGPCVRARRTSGPGACRGMAGFARHALVLGSPPAQLRPIGPMRPICPTALSFWHVADVPGVQGELLPAGAWGSAPHPPIS